MMPHANNVREYGNSDHHIYSELCSEILVSGVLHMFCFIYKVFHAKNVPDNSWAKQSYLHWSIEELSLKDYLKNMRPITCVLECTHLLEANSNCMSLSNFVSETSESASSAEDGRKDNLIQALIYNRIIPQ